MDWDKGYSSAFYMVEINPITWTEIERIEITGGTVSLEPDGLRQSASVDCLDYKTDKERWVRIYMDTQQENTGAHVPLFTGLAVCPDINIKGTWSETSLQCYSILKAVDDVNLVRGWYAPAGMDSSYLINELMEPVPSSVRLFNEEPPTLNTPIVAEAGETNLTMIEKILEAINWNLRIDGYGNIYIGPYPKESSVVFDPLSYDVIETEISVKSDWFSCPNVFMASCNGATAVARDVSDDSPLSIQNRGREVWKYENDVTLNAKESLNEYAQRRLKEEQNYSLSASYNRRYIPDIFPYDIVTLHYPSQGLVGNFMITKQDITLGYGAPVSEEIVEVKDDRI